MLKKFLEQYDHIGVINYIKDTNNTTILMQQSVFTYVKRIFNNEYIELNVDNNSIYNISKLLLKNNPEKILINDKKEHEENIILLYHDGLKIDLIGYKR